MPRTTIENKRIDLHRNIPDILPVKHEGYEHWNIRVLPRAPHTCKNYLSPNRREFYKIMYVTKGIGLFTLGLKNFYIDQPTILFLHPNEIISWQKLNTESEGYICFFRKSMADEHPLLKAQIEKYRLFSDTARSVIRLTADEIVELNAIFANMLAADTKSNAPDPLAEDAMAAWLQLVMIAGVRTGRYAEPDAVTEDYKRIHDFFHLLEQETANINYNEPVQLRTAKEFADKLFVHPNHLNVLLKKHTGLNVSAHIKNRLLEESKILLLRTDWTLQDIGYAVGFSDQPNFSVFFKKNAGMTPAEYRRSHQLK
jgi:AraC family transcriptional regulator, transcriptional activator of pobA